MTGNLTKKPLDVGAIINQSAISWRKYNAGLKTVEKLADSEARDPIVPATMAKLTLRAVRDDRRLLRRYLRVRFAIKLTGSFPRVRMRIVDRERARPRTLFEAVRQYDLLIGYMTLDLALWSMGFRGTRQPLPPAHEDLESFE